MKISFAQDISFYGMASEEAETVSSSTLSPTILLSMVRSLVDLLIENEILATLLIKLPPGNIWHSEIQRYHSWSNGQSVTYTCKFDDKEQKFESVQNLISLLPSAQMRREYFIMVLSPQFNYLILAHRPRFGGKAGTLGRRKNINTPKLLTLTSFDKKNVLQVLNGIEQVAIKDAFPISISDFDYHSTYEPSICNQLFVKQIEHQEKIHREKANRDLNRVIYENKKLQYALQSKYDYLARVCHEIRNPLTHMKTALSLLNSQSIKIPQRQRYLDMLKGECDRQNSLITGVLDLANIEQNVKPPVLETIRLYDIVPGIVSTYQPVAQEKGIMLGYTVPKDLPEVSCISAELKQIVINLLSNSINFTPKGGQVLVKARVQGDAINIEFSDTGVGIASTDIDKIFDCFYRQRPPSKQDSEGAGLGLSIVKQLLLRCGGSISVKSKPQEGSTFTVKLPYNQ
ncbi:MAG: ATPase [Scytonematopsis contorta HA4267-MV1]|jgi:signal transduction histidine kinase|nr:ATPase [Scytonematopsis contorta HA4267-MV1]